MSWTVWTWIFLVVILKIPMAAACYLVWYAIKAEPDLDGEIESDSDKGPRQKLPPFPRWPRRGPAGGGVACKEPPCPSETPRRKQPATAVARSRD